MMKAAYMQILRRQFSQHPNAVFVRFGFRRTAHAAAPLSSSHLRIDGSIQHQQRSYRSTTHTNLQERRTRRRRGGITGGLMTDDSSRKRDHDDSSGSASTGPGALHHAPVTDRAKFQEAAQAILKKLYNAVQPMKAINETFEVTLGIDHVVADYSKDSDEEDNDDDESREGDSNSIGQEGSEVATNGILTIGLDPPSGTYIIETDALNYSLTMHSPVSGAHTYVLSQRTGEWVGIEDGHNFEGLFVRDIIRQCKGVPNL